MIDNTTLIKQAFEQPTWYLQGTAYNIKVRVETINEFIKNPKVGDILDIGCGDGSLSLSLLNANNRITFLDQSAAMIGIARARVPDAFSSQVQSVNTGFMEADLEPHSFDLILCVGVLAYVRERRDFAVRIKSLLKSGGIVIVECTDGAHFVNRIVVAYHALRRVFKPVQLRTVVGPSAEVMAIFKDMGFQLCSSFRYSLPLPGIRKLMSQKTSYGMIRRVFGNATRSRNAWLGNECMYCYKCPDR